MAQKRLEDRAGRGAFLCTAWFLFSTDHQHLYLHPPTSREAHSSHVWNLHIRLEKRVPDMLLSLACITSLTAAQPVVRELLRCATVATRSMVHSVSQDSQPTFTIVNVRLLSRRRRHRADGHLKSKFQGKAATNHSVGNVGCTC